MGSIRVRSVNKIGKGRYITTNNSLSSYLIYKLFYWILCMPIYAFFKYCFYIPIKWCINKISNLITNK